jgi:hypothetical protein
MLKFLSSVLGLFILLLLIEPQKMAVIGFIVGGRVVSPEGSTMLYNYCFGNRDTVEIQSDYIKTSPVVLNSIKGMKVGQTKKVHFKQYKDWRLSYAFNPYHITREKDGYIMYEYIKFDTTGKIYTDLNLGITQVRVYDNIVHTFKCKPYVAIYRFKL